MVIEEKKGTGAPFYVVVASNYPFMSHVVHEGLFGLKKFPFIILHGGLLDTILEQIDRVLKVNSLLAAGERR